jgi:hypothetical protein
MDTYDQAVIEAMRSANPIARQLDNQRLLGWTRRVFATC